ncbi:hypothetical protein KZ813_17855 [Sphingomonas sp. RHCKR7]|uniref:hypothetical protein n=1 Tax=Sphingomonas folli TaxID=2862497 RepID=UPI001CA52395|nr:hypothetical protein [Sphingomonas folli]MBW6528710.1 hypothetical protein [Sphingomonas folli]
MIKARKKAHVALLGAVLTIAAKPALAQTDAEVEAAKRKYEASLLAVDTDKKNYDALRLAKLRKEIERGEQAKRELAELGALPASATAPPSATLPATSSPTATASTTSAEAAGATPSKQQRQEVANARPTVAGGQEPEATPPPPSDQYADLTERQISATKKFADLNLDVGLSLTLDLGSRDRVVDAELINGIVRVKESRNSVPRVMLGAHYLFLPEKSFFGLVDKKLWGWGPFIAIQPGTNEIVQAVGAGLMVGFRRSLETRESFNLGIGLAIDPSVQVLGDNVFPNKPLPNGETELRFKTSSQKGLLIYSSFSF